MAGDRLDTAKAGLGQAVAPARLKVHVNSRGVTLRASDDRPGEATRRLGAFRDHDEGEDQADACVLRRALPGKMGRSETRAADRPKVASLHRQGVLAIAGGGAQTGRHIRLTAAAAHAFDIK